MRRNERGRGWEKRIEQKSCEFGFFAEALQRRTNKGKEEKTRNHVKRMSHQMYIHIQYTTRAQESEQIKSSTNKR